MKDVNGEKQTSKQGRKSIHKKRKEVHRKGRQSMVMEESP